MAPSRTFVGIGGWSYEPWRKTFYPKHVNAKGELAWASRQLSAIEINVTYHRNQTPDHFKRWRDETPDDFQFAVKASRLATNRKSLGDVKPAIDQFLASGLEQLGEKLGPILWQLMPTKKFVPEELDAFLRLLPKKPFGRPLQHVLEVRHESFVDPAYVALARKHRISTVFADHDAYPCIPEQTGDIVYARLMRTREKVKTGYTPSQIATWHDHVRAWQSEKRDVYVFFINGAKERAPAAALALHARLAAP